MPAHLEGTEQGADEQVVLGGQQQVPVAAVFQRARLAGRGHRAAGGRVVPGRLRLLRGNPQVAQKTQHQTGARLSLTVTLTWRGR